MPRFWEIKEEFEKKITGRLSFELLELRYSGYAFGSGTMAYRIKGYNLLLNYDGRDFALEVSVSAPHQKYPQADWRSIFYGSPEVFFDKEFNLIFDELI